MIRTDTSTPDIAIAETIVAEGALVGPDSRIELPHIRLQRARYAFDEPWKMRAYARPADQNQMHQMLHDGSADRGLRIEGRTDSREEFLIRDTVLLGASGRELRLKVNQFDYGKRELATLPQTQFATVTLTPTNFAFERESEVDDSIRGKYRNTGPLFTWSSSVGEFTLEKVVQHESVSLHKRRLTVDVPHIWLHGEIQHEKRTLRPHELIDVIERELRWLLAILDLVDRRRVFWSEIRLHSRIESPDWCEENCGRWRVASATDTPDYLSSLVLPRRAPPNILDLMCQALRGFPHPERLAIAVAFMVSAHKSGYLEEKLMAAFAAFEATVSGLPAPADQLVEDVKMILRDLRQALDTLPALENAPPAVSERVRQRLAQVPEAPIARRAALLADQYGVAWADLWPGSTNLEAELSKALRIRNLLFHTGQLENGFRAGPEAERVLVLTERLLFLALGGQRTHLYERAYDHVPYILRAITEPPLP